MFLGHFAVGLAAKPLAPRVPLPVLLAAPQVMDLAWPIFVGIGVERARIEPGHLEASPLVLEHMPYSHSLATGVGWAVAAARPPRAGQPSGTVSAGSSSGVSGPSSSVSSFPASSPSSGLASGSSAACGAARASPPS